MKLGIGTKLAMGFGVLVVMIVVLSLYSYQSMNTIGKAANLVSDRSGELEYAADIQIAATNALMPVNDYLISGNKVEVDNFKKDLADVRQRLDAVRKKGLDEKGSAVLQKVDSNLALLESQGMEILAAKVSAANANMTDPMKKFDAQGDKLVEAIEGMHENYRGAMSDTIKSSDETKKSAIRLLVIISLASIILGVGIGVVVSRAVSAPILALVGVAKGVAAGDLTRHAAVKTKDEIGQLGEAINQMVSGLKDMVNTVNQSAAQVAAAADQVNGSSHQINKGAQTQAGAAEETSASMEEMAASIQTVANNAQDLAANVDETSASINQMVASIEQVAKNSEVMASSVSETSATVEQMSASTERVARDADNLAASVEETSATIEQMVASIDHVAKNSQALSSAVSETSSTIEEMAASIKQVAKNVAEADQLSQKAALEAKAGGEAVDLTVEGMTKISGAMQVTSEVVGGLGRRSEEIGKIIGVIEDIADQTNLLALNAAIEAARAGDAGRGFAVVADEVRKLAERSVVATKEIGEVIKQVQQETTRAVKTAEQGAAETVEGKKLADKAGAALKRILESVGSTNRLMSEINNASMEQATAAAQVLMSVDKMNIATNQVTDAVKEQSLGSTQIRKAVENMNSTTQQVAGAMKEQAQAARHIKVAVEDMNRLTGQVNIAAKEQALGGAQIMSAVTGMNSMTQQVANATSEQKSGGEQIVKAIENISDIARDNLVSVQQMVKASENITFQAESLQRAVSVFKVRDMSVNCWDILNCKTEFRFKCPAYQNPEKRCWLIQGTWCKGVLQGDARSKLANCMHCQAFKVMQGIGYLPAAGSGEAGAGAART